jgi:HlyD family secretion protein
VDHHETLSLRAVEHRGADAAATDAAPSKISESLRRRQRRRRWAPIAVASLAAVAALLLWRVFGGGPTVHYVTAPITRGDVVRVVTSSGTVNPQTTVQVGSYVSGTVQDVRCDYNTRVRKGQLCAKIDPRPYQSAVDQAGANVEAAQAQLAKDRSNLALQEANYNRARALFDQQLLSKDQFDASKASYEQAKSQIQVDQGALTQRTATLKSAQVNLGYTDIVSPVDGTVVSRNVTVGQTVAASFQTPTLFLIATDLTKMQIDTNVSEGDIGSVRPGAPVSFTVEAFAGQQFDGTVTQVRLEPQAVQNVVTYDVVVTVANPELLLKPGMTANVRIVVDQRRNVLRVPDQALRYVPGGVAGAAEGATARPPSILGFGRFTAGRAGRVTRPETARQPANAEGETANVYVLRDGQPVQVPVVIGLDDDTNSEILEGAISASDRVVVSEAQGGESSVGGRGRP